MRLTRTRRHLAAVAALLVVTGCTADDGPTTAAPAPIEEPAAVEPEPADEAEPATQAVPDVVGDDDLAVTEDGTDGPGGTTISIVEEGTDFAFAPVSVTVAVDEQVTFVHDGAVSHTVSGGGLNSGPLETGDEYVVTFDEAGEVSYLCYFHPEMTGTITVE